MLPTLPVRAVGQAKVHHVSGSASRATRRASTVSFCADVPSPLSRFQNCLHEGSVVPIYRDEYLDIHERLKAVDKVHKLEKKYQELVKGAKDPLGKPVRNTAFPCASAAVLPKSDAFACGAAAGQRQVLLRREARGEVRGPGLQFGTPTAFATR